MIALTDLGELAVGVVATLDAASTDPADADGLPVAVAVDLAALSRLLGATVPEVANFVVRAVAVAPTLLISEVITGSGVARLTGRTVGVLLAAARIVADVVDTLCGIGTLIVALTVRPEDAAIADALEGVFAVGIALAGDGLAVASVAAFARGAVTVAVAVSGNATTSVHTFTALRTVGVTLAALNLRALRPDTSLPGGTVAVLTAGLLLNAFPAEEVALLAASTVGIGATSRFGLAAPGDALAPAWTVGVVSALRASRHTDALLALLVVWTVGVGLTRLLLLATLPVLADEPLGAVRVGRALL